MLALATIPVTCWLCTLIATPRRPRFGDEVAELVYSRLLGRQQLLRLVAIIMTGALFLVLVLTLPSHATSNFGMSQTEQIYCGQSATGFTACYARDADGVWVLQ